MKQSNANNKIKKWHVTSTMILLSWHLNCHRKWMQIIFKTKQATTSKSSRKKFLTAFLPVFGVSNIQDIKMKKKCNTKIFVVMADVSSWKSGQGFRIVLESFDWNLESFVFLSSQSCHRILRIIIIISCIKLGRNKTEQMNRCDANYVHKKKKFLKSLRQNSFYCVEQK